jgi:hypothetical protein
LRDTATRYVSWKPPSCDVTFTTSVLLPGGTGTLYAVPASSSRRAPAYSDEKVANREIRVWHFVIENGYCMMDKSKTPRHKVR